MMSGFDPFAASADEQLIVYLDIKSPYAYLSVGPTRDMARELGLRVAWRPLSLDIPSYLGSAKLGEDGEVVEHKRSEEQWRQVKYAYRDCRRYASLPGLTVRGTVKIWDTSLVHIGWMWAARQGPECVDAYLDAVYPPFWRRELDVEDEDVVVSLLETAGCDVQGSRDYLHREGRLQHDAEQQAIFDAGIFGVPSFVLPDATDQRVFFGREHLPRIAWRLSQQRGRRDPEPDIAYRGFGPEQLAGTPAPSGKVHAWTVAVDLRQLESYLFLGPFLDLVGIQRSEGSSISVRWISWPAVQSQSSTPGDGGAEADRGSRHFAFRAAYEAREREAAVRRHGLEIAPRMLLAAAAAAGAGAGDVSAFERALLRVDRLSPHCQEVFLQTAFDLYWLGELDASASDEMADLLAECGAPVDVCSEVRQGSAAREAEAAREVALEEGVIGAPCVVADGEPFLGRAHFPMLHWLAGSARTPKPI